MKLHKRNNNYILTSIKLPAADEMLLENGEFAQQFIKENATDDYEIIELHMSSTYGGGR